MAELAVTTSGPPRTHSFRALVAEQELKEQLFGPEAGGAEHSFRARFCERFRCAPANYEREAFRRCVYWRARLLAPLLLKVWPGFFEEDFTFLQRVGQAGSLRRVSMVARRWRGGTWVLADFLHNGCRIRVSTRKVLRLARELLPRPAR